MTETPEHRIKRLRMRSMRRGIKEMDIILDRFATQALGEMSGPDLELYDALLDENDQDLYRWVTAQEAAPERFAAMILRIAGVVEGG